MDRFLSQSNRLLLGWAVCLLVAVNAGCSILAAGYWVVNPNDAPAEYKGLRDSRVVVVCRTMNDLQYRNAAVANQLSGEVARKLKDRVKNIEMVPQSEVDNWLDNNQGLSYLEIGKALDADKVVAIDLAHFSLFEGTTLFQGRAGAEVIVYDVATGEETFVRAPLETLYPPNNPIARDSSTSEAGFRRKFVEVLADQIARTFYAYDSRAASGKDVFYVR